MDLTNLRKIVAVNTPIGSTSSLPFAIQKDNVMKIRWFIYDTERDGQDLKLIVTRACTLDRTGRIFIKSDIKLKFTLENYTSYNEFDEEEYYSRFEQLFNDNDKEALDALLEFVEDVPSLIIYDTIAKLEDK